MSLRQPIPDEAVVMRAGTMHDRDRLVEAAEDARVNPEMGIHGVSVECFESRDEALRTTRRPNRSVRFSTAGQLRAAGFAVIATSKEPHATVELPKPLDDAAWDRLQSIFDPPVRNPYAGRRA